MTPESIVKESDLIAVAIIETVHEVETPEGIRVRSATARIDRLIYRRKFKISDDFDTGLKKSPVEIVIYEVDANPGRTDDGPLFQKTDDGRCLVLLKARGFGKFAPYFPLSVQKVDDEKVSWPIQGSTYGKVPLKTVYKQLEDLLPK